MSTNVQTTAQLAAALAGDPQVEREVEKEIKRSALVSHFLALRIKKGLTQEDIASAMKCDPSKISRIESGSDANLKWPDICGYAHALNLQLSLTLDDSDLPAAENIKRCVFRIRKDLDKLTELAKSSGTNDELAKKIYEFSGEVLFNFLLQYRDHAEMLDSVFKVPTRSPLPVTCDSEEPSTETRLEPATASPGR